jgi:hypothetical protein
LAGVLVKVYTAQAEILTAGRGLVEYMGRSSAAALEVLGDLVNELDAGDEDDDWVDPIIEAAQARWPVVESAPVAPAGDAAMPIARVEPADNQDGFVFAEIEGRMKFLRAGDLIYSAPLVSTGDASMPVAAWIRAQTTDDASDYMGACKRNDGLYGVPPIKQADALAVVAARDAEIARLTAERDALRKDAARYRWLTDGKRPKYIWNFVLSDDEKDAGPPSWESLDSAIDAAMIKEGA